MTCEVWRVACEVWCVVLVCGVWCVVCEVLCVRCEVWCVMCEVYCARQSAISIYSPTRTLPLLPDIIPRLILIDHLVSLQRVTYPLANNPTPRVVM